MNDDDKTDEYMGVSSVIEHLDKLQLSRIVIPLDYDYDELMDSSNYCYFLDSHETLTKASGISFSTIINESCNLLNTCLQLQTNTTIQWSQFVSNNIEPKPLSYLLYCYIRRALEDLSNTIHLKNGLSATRLFLLASTFKNETDTRFFNISVLEKCVKLIKYSIDKFLKFHEYYDLLVDLLGVVHDLAIVAPHFQFADKKKSVDCVIRALLDFTRLEKNAGNILEQVPKDLSTYGQLALIAYSGLTNTLNVTSISTYVVIQKILFHMIVDTLQDEYYKMELTTRQFNVVCDHHFSFIRKLILKLDDLIENCLAILLKQLLYSLYDYSKFESRKIRILLEIWRLCPNEIRIQIKYDLFCMVYDENVTLSVFALEMFFQLLSEPEETESEDPLLLYLMPVTKHEFTVGLILSTIQDSSFDVRVKAFSLFAILTSGPPSATAYQTTLIRRLLLDPYYNVENLNQTFHENEFHDFKQYLKKNNLANYNKITSKSKIYPRSKYLLLYLKFNARDKNALIRGLSVTIIYNFFLINKTFMDNFDLSFLTDKYTDTSVFVRQVTVEKLTALVFKYPDKYKFWFHGLIHMIVDWNTQIQDMAVECFDRVILKCIKPYSTEIINSNDQLNDLPWLILDYAIRENMFNKMMCLCKKWYVNGFLTHRTVENVMTYVNESNPRWLMQCFYIILLISHQIEISNMSAVLKMFDVDSWILNDVKTEELTISNGQMLLSLIFLNHTNLDQNAVQQLMDRFEQLLFKCKLKNHLIPKCFDLYLLISRVNDSDKVDRMEKLFEFLCNYVQTFTTNMNDEEMVIRRIVTLGCIGLMLNLKLKTNIKTCLFSVLYKTNRSISSAIQSTVISTVAKLSIVDEQLAEEAIIQFRKILTNPQQSSIQIDALNALVNLCIHRKTLVKQAIPDMCVCLKSKNVFLKRVTLQTLTDLILEDKIKLGDIAFSVLLCMFHDSDIVIREITFSFTMNYSIFGNKDTVVQRIIDIIFHINGYTGERSCTVDDYITNTKMNAFFSMEADTIVGVRNNIYRLMLKYMLDSDKLKLMKKIFEVFEEIVKDVSTTTSKELKKRAILVIKDALCILRTKYMVLTYGKQFQGNLYDYPNILERVEYFANKLGVIETYKMVATDFLIPRVMKIKSELDENDILSPVMNDLVAYLCILTSDKSPIKNDVIRSISTDSRLLNSTLEVLRLTKNIEILPEIEDGDELYNYSYDELRAQLLQNFKLMHCIQIIDIRDQSEIIDSNIYYIISN